MSKKQIQEAKKKIEGIIRESLEFSRSRGDTPYGVERLWGELHEEKFNWKILLQRYITEMLPYDQSWRNFGKKTYGTGVYNPMTLKEQIDVMVAIDVSGSISDKDLTNFVSEIVGISKQFKNRINMKIITHECEVLDEFNVFNENDIKNIKIKGCGGTCFEPVVDYIKQKHKTTKCLIWLTDGEGEIELDKQPFKIIWTLTENGDDKLLHKSGNVLKLKEILAKEI
jgi:predicted metal-dependent peptidase